MIVLKSSRSVLELSRRLCSVTLSSRANLHRQGHEGQVKIAVPTAFIITADLQVQQSAGAGKTFPS
jgi:hypothetical protein